VEIGKCHQTACGENMEDIWWAGRVTRHTFNLQDWEGAAQIGEQGKKI